MGYNTDFSGSFQITPPLNEHHKKYLQAFTRTRRMKRDPKKTENLEDPLRKEAMLHVGPEGDFYVGKVGSDMDFDDWPEEMKRRGILDINRPPKDQPSLWCDFIFDDSGTTLTANDGKNYNYLGWIHYLIDTFLKPWGYTLNGEIEYFGENREDHGKIVIKKNKVRLLVAKTTFVDAEEE